MKTPARHSLGQAWLSPPHAAIFCPATCTRQAPMQELDITPLSPLFRTSTCSAPQACQLCSNFLHECRHPRLTHARDSLAVMLQTNDMPQFLSFPSPYCSHVSHLLPYTTTHATLTYKEDLLASCKRVEKSTERAGHLELRKKKQAGSFGF